MGVFWYSKEGTMMGKLLDNHSLEPGCKYKLVS